MTDFSPVTRSRLVVRLAIMLCLMAAHTCLAQEILGSYWQGDTPFPEYSRFWSDSSRVEWEPEMAATPKANSTFGGYAHVFVRNTGSGELRIQDASIDRISLKRAIAFSATHRKLKKISPPASIYFSDLSESEKRVLMDAGEPVWWKAEPRAIAPGGTGEVVVRLRRLPKSGKVAIGIVCDPALPVTAVSINNPRPHFTGISFSRDLTQAYLYASHPQGSAPIRVLMDGSNITADVTIGRDSSVSTTPVVCRLRSPLDKGSYHTFRFEYEDGSYAIAGQRAWSDEITYALWGGRPGKETDVEVARAYIRELAEHNINTQMDMIGSRAVSAFMNSREGKQLMQSLDIRRIVGEPGKADGPRAYYLADEPDTGDFRVEGVPARSKVGCLGQGLVDHAEKLRDEHPETPNMLNVDMTFKPENWYTYGQLADTYAADPYYQTRLGSAYAEHPGQVPLYTKATFVYAVGSVCQSACAPKPLHLILNCTRLQKKDWKFRFGTPEEKRIEVFYALASGAKAFSYWWFVPIAADAVGSCGCSVNEPEAKDLWREIGLLGAEVRTLDSVITNSCPASMQTKASQGLWVRSLVSGLDTVVLLCVNDNYANDRLGTVIEPIEKAELSVAVPSWLDPKSAFEITSDGTRDIQWQKSGSQAAFSLGTVEVARLVVVTGDPGLRTRLQQTYDTRFSANVERLRTETR